MERILESNRVTSPSRCENNKNFEQKKTALEIEMDLDGFSNINPHQTLLPSCVPIRSQVSVLIKFTSPSLPQVIKKSPRLLTKDQVGRLEGMNELRITFWIILVDAD